MKILYVFLCNKYSDLKVTENGHTHTHAHSHIHACKHKESLAWPNMISQIQTHAHNVHIQNEIEKYLHTQTHMNDQCKWREKTTLNRIMCAVDALSFPFHLLNKLNKKVLKNTHKTMERVYVLCVCVCAFSLSLFSNFIFVSLFSTICVWVCIVLCFQIVSLLPV